MIQKIEKAKDNKYNIYISQIMQTTDGKIVEVIARVECIDLESLERQKKLYLDMIKGIDEKIKAIQQIILKRR